MKIVQKGAGLLFVLLVGLAPPLHAVGFFTFNSQGTGEDGGLLLTADECPNNPTEVVIDMGVSGVKQYESVSVHANCLVTFTPTGDLSAPVRLIVQGAVQIDGVLNLDGREGVTEALLPVVGGIGGPGGFDGGRSGVDGGDGQGGSGVYGGEAGVDGGQVGNGGLMPATATPADQPLIGGAGGGGAYNYGGGSSSAGSGGGGGGALLIATSGRITVNGTLSALGAQGGEGTRAGGRGADGMIRLIANAIDGSGAANAGHLIFETMDYTGTIGSNAFINVISFQQMALGEGPSLTISSVGGQTVTPGEGLVLDRSGAVQVVVTSSHLAAGMRVTLIAHGDAAGSSVETITLDANGSATGTVTIGSGISLITAYVSGEVDEQTTTLRRYRGEEVVAARLVANLGEKSAMTFYTRSGQVVPSDVARDWQLERHVRFKTNQPG